MFSRQADTSWDDSFNRPCARLLICVSDFFFCTAPKLCEGDDQGSTCFLPVCPSQNGLPHAVLLFEGPAAVMGGGLSNPSKRL